MRFFDQYLSSIKVKFEAGEYKESCILKYLVSDSVFYIANPQQIRRVALSMRYTFHSFVRTEL